MAISLPAALRRKKKAKHTVVEIFEPVAVGMNLSDERYELHGAVADSFYTSTPCGVVFADQHEDNKPSFKKAKKPDVVLPPGDYLVVRLPEGSITHVLHNARASNLTAAKAWLAVAKDYLNTAKEFSVRVQQNSPTVNVPLKKAYDASLFALRAVSVLRATPPFTDDLYSVIGTLKALGSRIPPEWARLEKKLRHSVELTAIEGHEELEVPNTPHLLDTSLKFAKDVVQWASQELKETKNITNRNPSPKPSSKPKSQSQQKPKSQPRRL